jgi:hypothetical protein
MTAQHSHLPTRRELLTHLSARSTRPYQTATIDLAHDDSTDRTIAFSAIAKTPLLEKTLTFGSCLPEWAIMMMNAWPKAGPQSSSNGQERSIP